MTLPLDMATEKPNWSAAAASLAVSTNAAARSVEIASQMYEKGMIDYQPLLDSERVLTHEQDTLAESRGLVGIHLVAVYKALGGGWEMPAPPAAVTSKLLMRAVRLAPASAKMS